MVTAHLRSAGDGPTHPLGKPVTKLPARARACGPSRSPWSRKARAGADCRSRRCAPRAIVVPKVGERRKVSSPSLNTTDLRGGRSWAVGLWWWSAGPDRPGGRHQDDRLVGWSGRLRPAAMGGALDAEVAHLALDEPRVGAQPTLGDQVPQKLSYRGRDGPGQPPRGKSPPAA